MHRMLFFGEGRPSLHDSHFILPLLFTSLLRSWSTNNFTQAEKPETPIEGFIRKTLNRTNDDLCPKVLEVNSDMYYSIKMLWNSTEN